jgi:hypothetical protein
MNYPKAPSSALPTLIMPCLNCGGRLIMASVEPTSFGDDLDDITHRCNQCGAEVTRTVRRGKQVA